MSEWCSVLGNCYVLLLFFVALHYVPGDCYYDYPTSGGVFQCFFCHYYSYNCLLQGHLQLQLNRMWFHHCWCHRMQGVLLASPLSHRNCLSPRCLFRHMPISHDPLQVSFSFRVKLPTCLCMYISVCSGVCFLFSGYIVDAGLTHEGSSVGVCITVALQSIPITGICVSWWWSKVQTRWLLPLLLQVKGSLVLLSKLSSSHSGNLVGHTALGTQKIVPNPSAFPSWWRGMFFSRFGSTWWHGWLQICGRHETLWFWCCDLVSGWWVYSHLVGGVLLLTDMFILVS